MPRAAGHRAGAEAVRRVLEAAPSLGIGALTLYAFSADNWQRPAAEVQGLFRLLGRYLREESARCVREGVRLEAIGRRDRLSAPLRGAIQVAERVTAGGQRLHLRLAIDYSSRAAIARGEAPIPDVDLLIRTGGERRLSDFLLRESAYAELHFTPCPWPDFDGAALAAAVAEFGRRQRRFGGLPSGGDALPAEPGLAGQGAPGGGGGAPYVAGSRTTLAHPSSRAASRR
jgi:undecaprenyl diphosphate synthase